MGIVKYTTPIQALKVKKVDITDCEVYVTFKQGSQSLTMENDDLEMEVVGSDTIIYVSFTQEQSALFDTAFKVSVQVNWIDGEGNRLATNIKQIPWCRNLQEEVIE